MGRQLTLPLFVATLVATWYGGIFGVTEIAFNKGVFNFVTQGFFWYITYIIFALYLVKKIRPYQAVTLPDLVSKMFGERSGKLSAIFNFMNVLPIVYVISLGLFLKIFFGGDLIYMMLLGVCLVLSYSLLGGLRAIVFSDITQFTVMCASVFLVLAFSVGTFGGLGFLTENLPSSYFSLTADEGLMATLVWGFLALATLVDPNFYQRCFAAKSDLVAKKGILVSTFIWFCFDICTTFGAMYAKAVIPNAQAGEAYLTYALQLLPNGLKGFMLAGILATIVSTLDSYLLVAGTSLAHDLSPKKWKNKIAIHHLGMVVSAGLAIFIAYQFDGSIKETWKTLGSYSAACLLFPVLIGHVFPKKITDNQFVFSCLASAAVTTWWKLEKPNVILGISIPIMDELYAGVLTSLVSLLLYTLVQKSYQKYYHNSPQ